MSFCAPVTQDLVYRGGTILTSLLVHWHILYATTLSTFADLCALKNLLLWIFLNTLFFTTESKYVLEHCVHAFAFNVLISQTHDHLASVNMILCMTAAFRNEVDEIRSLLGYCSAYHDNSVLTLRDSLPALSARVKNPRRFLDS
jgi:hypothetical protein